MGRQGRYTAQKNGIRDDGTIWILNAGEGD